MTESISVEIPQNKIKSYPIYIDKSPVKDLSDVLKDIVKNKKYLVVISKKVYHLYKNDFLFDKKSLFIMSDGENQKNLQNYLKIVKKAFEIGLSRKDVVIAIGGGVVGDITGYFAATYLRGIEFIQIPTTLLSFVDSSVGGKTGIDLPYAKNYLGAFYQPSKVFINLNFLKTLDEKQMKSGIGEVLKYAFIELSCQVEETFFLMEYLLNNTNNIYNRDLDVLEKLVIMCLNLKISVVTKDEKELNLRKILNFGHTLGHALETITNYKKYTHGEAVVYGMMFVFNYALKLNVINQEYYNLAFGLFRQYKFKNIKISKSKQQKLIDIMKYDKKSYSDKIVLIIPNNQKQVTELEVSDTTEFVF